MDRAYIVAALIVALLAFGCSRDSPPITVGSKNFLEQVLLGEIAAQHLERRLGYRIGRKLNLGGTMLAHRAIMNGDIDLYPEYLGTGATAILNFPASADAYSLLETVRREYGSRFDLRWLDPLGFNNTFAMVIRKADAERLHVRSLTDAARSGTAWHLGMGYEFQQRPDGLPNLLRTYHLLIAGTPKVMDLGLLYRALEQGDVNMVAANSTDGLLLSLNVTMLEDDLKSFPPYHAAFVVRARALNREPRLEAALQELRGKFSDTTMRQLNHEVLAQHGQVQKVAEQFLQKSGLLETNSSASSCGLPIRCCGARLAFPANRSLE
ncbi:MAG TPA: glycine betaine ABC transporter substrate-binding protein [Nitrospira sp.]|nr:glycine betaine ABC transporter substrate-binding protein [Nitrospira sp.]